MGSELSPANGPDAERLNAYKLKAERRLRAGEVKAYTPPKALRSFLSQQLPELNVKNRCEHELLLMSTQTYDDSQTSFVSTICGRCRHHFHFKSNGQSSHVRKLDQSHPQHMLLPYETNRQGELLDDGPRGKYDDAYGVVRMVCCDHDCLFTIEIAAMAPRVTPRDIAAFEDQSRVRENLAAARKDDPERYADVDEDYGAQPAGTMLKYLSDHLARAPESGPLKIKKRNKRFMVSFSTDFNPLLRSLGWVEQDDPDGEACWFLPEPMPKRKTTPVKTLEARYEDAQAELNIAFSTSRTTPAWNLLLKVFQAGYTAFVSPPATFDQIPETAVNLLGCLLDYAPAVFSWAAILLATVNPAQRDEYMSAGLTCIADRNEGARDNLVIYQSSFDPVATSQFELEDAFAYFGSTPYAGHDYDFFHTKRSFMLEHNPSDSEKAKADRYLRVLGDYFTQQVMDGNLPQGSANTTQAAISSSGSKMSIKAAAELLGVEASYHAELVGEFLNNLDETVPREKIVEALEVLAELKQQQDNLSEAEAFLKLASFFKESGTTHMTVPKFETRQPSPVNDPPPSMDTPPGIRNIGNTCYLNSLLQYFYNVKPIRGILENFDEVKLELDREHVAQRRTGGNSLALSLDEAIVARQFAEELRDLFLQLEKTTEVAVQPSQKLANTALSSAAELLTKKPKSTKDTKPPPLPARPSPAPPTPASQDVDMVNVTVEAVDDKASATSPASSSPTLVDDVEPVSIVSAPADIKAQDGTVQSKMPPTPAVSEPAEEDTKMEDLPEDLPMTERTERISQKLEQSDRSGTSQQDVEEIIGNILEHLLRSVRPSGPAPDMPSVQADIITNTFFATMVHHTVDMKEDKSENTRKEIALDRMIHAFPHSEKSKPVSSSLYEALDRNLGYELLSNERARYSTIRSLPPILHICIQRTEGSGQKNRNPVVIPSVLYMDRFMDAEEGTDLWRIRRKAWALQARRDELESRVSKDAEFAIEPADNSMQFDPPPTVPFSTEEVTEDLPPELNSDLLRDLAPVANKRKDSTSPPPSSKRPKSADRNTDDIPFSYVDFLFNASANTAEATNTELRAIKKEAEEAFSHLTQYKYAIHAIICHGGGMNAGHYWVWIRDYQRSTWLKYNDAVVTVDKRDVQTVLDELNQGGDPYYVAYVKDEVKDDLVDVPMRTIPVDTQGVQVQHVEGRDSALSEGAMQIETIEGVEMDASGSPKVGSGEVVEMKQPVPIKGRALVNDEPPPYEII